LRARITLFRSICDAVQYAHQRLIVHRDLKPPNILVARDGTPKLLDFGISKILASGETEHAATQTLTGFLAMTPGLRGA
jgi:serine/threonine-protein kinase